jgi:DNA topoisomerase-3
LENNKAYTCEDKNCDFVLFKDDKFLKKFKKKLNKKMVKELLKDNKTHVDKLYSKKKDKYFEADLSLIKNGKYWNYKFNF